MGYVETDSMKVLDKEELERDYGVLDFDTSYLTPDQVYEAVDIITEILESHKGSGPAGHLMTKVESHKGSGPAGHLMTKDGTLTSQTRKQVLKERLSSIYGEMRGERSE